jgi:hypothetical protein
MHYVTMIRCGHNANSLLLFHYTVQAMLRESSDRGVGSFRCSSPQQWLGACLSLHLWVSPGQSYESSPIAEHYGVLVGALMLQLMLVISNTVQIMRRESNYRGVGSFRCSSPQQWLGECLSLHLWVSPCRSYESSPIVEHYGVPVGTLMLQLMLVVLVKQA